MHGIEMHFVFTKRNHNVDVGFTRCPRCPPRVARPALSCFSSDILIDWLIRKLNPFPHTDDIKRIFMGWLLNIWGKEEMVKSIPHRFFRKKINFCIIILLIFQLTHSFSPIFITLAKKAYGVNSLKRENAVL